MKNIFFCQNIVDDLKPQASMMDFYMFKQWVFNDICGIEMYKRSGANLIKLLGAYLGA